MIFYEFGILCYGAANKVVKQDYKNGKDLNNICSNEVPGKYTNLFAEMKITTIKTFKDPFYNKGLPSFHFLRLPLEFFLKVNFFKEEFRIFTRSARIGGYWIFTRSARIGGYWSAPSMFKIQTPDSTRLNTIE